MLFILFFSAFLLNSHFHYQILSLNQQDKDKNMQTASHTIKGTFTSSKIAYKTQVI